MSSPVIAFDYIAQRFRQRHGSNTSMLLFVAAAGDLKKWAGVPRKTFDYQHGFQRTLMPSRVSDIASYFSADPRNNSPNSIVVGFDTGSPGVSVEPLAGSPKTGDVELVRLKIRVPDLDSEPLPALLELAITSLERRLPHDAVSLVRSDVAAAVQRALTLEDEQAADQTTDQSELAESTDTGLELQTRSYLIDFYAELLGAAQGLIPITEPDALRQILQALIKPAIIVDGQHRVFGAAAADETIALPVSALLGSSWPENVYQFVVINQKAKPIRPAFLSSIIATSLTDAEIDAVYDRLRISRIDVEKAEVMDIVNSSPDSPFRSLVDFEIEGAEGFLQFPGMSKLVTDFRNADRTHPVLVQETPWRQNDAWLQHFFALWNGVKDYFSAQDDRLWQEPTEENPNNLLKIVTLQEIQLLMLDNWADSRTVAFKQPAETRTLAAAFWQGFPATFFTDEWRKKGLQTSVGRSILRSAITEARRNIGRKSWGHRRLGLFQE